MNKQGNVQRFAAAAVIGFFCTVAVTQAADTLNTRYTYLTPSEGHLDGKASQNEFKAAATLDPPVLPPGQEYLYSFSIGGAFQANMWTFDDDRLDSIELYKVKVPMTGEFEATDKIHVSVSLVPGIHSDFEDVNEDDVRIEGAVVGSYPYSKTLRFVFGLAYGEDLGDPTLFPIGGAMWKVTDALQVDLLIPAPKISYAFTSDLRLYVAGEPAGGQWNVGESDEKVVDVKQEGYRVGAGAEYQLIQGGWLYAAVGAEGGRKISVGVDDNTEIEDYDLDDASFVQIGFRLR
jgi:hypothetical protein